MKYYSVLLLILFAQFTFRANSQQTVGAPVIRGKITGSNQVPVAGATIRVLNTAIAVISDSTGHFTCPPLQQGQYIVQVQAIGFATTEIPVTTNEPVNIQLTETIAQLDDVVVTAEKREVALQRVPVSVTALSARQAEEYRLWNSKDLSAIAPNLFVTNSGDNRNVTGIRGITTTSYDPAVTTYIDGVNQFSLDTYIGQLFEVERVEVLRGPQGTLYGRNAMGGVINIITKQPINTTKAAAEVNLGNYDRQRYSASFSTPLVKDKLLLGATLMYDKMDGYYTNTYTNSNFDKQHAVIGNYYMKYLISPKWNISLNAKHQLSRNNGPFPLAPSVEDAIKEPYTVNQDAATELVDNVVNVSATVQYTGKDFNFSSQTAYQNNYRYYDQPVDADFSPLDAITIINNYGKPWNNVEAVTQEFRFSSPASVGAKWQWTAGSYLFYQDNPTKQATHFGADAPLLGIPDTDFSVINTSTGTRKGVAVYGQGTYALNHALALIAGLRYDYEYARLNVRGQYQKDPDPEPVFDTQPDTASSAGFNAFSPKLGLQYTVSSQTMLFATYSRGFRTGGFTQLSSDPSQPPLYQFDPETSNNYEAGIKNTFAGNRLRLNATVFYSTINNAQVPTLVLPDAITVTRNAGKIESKGVELELAALPFKGLEASYALGYTDAVYTELKVPSDGAAVDLGGNKQVFTPSVTSMLALQYNHALSPKLNLVVRGEWAYFGEQYFDLANTIRQSPYHLLNTRIGLNTKQAGIYFWMRNITGTEYIAYAYEFGATHLGDPKTYGVTFSVQL